MNDQAKKIGLVILALLITVRAAGTALAHELIDPVNPAVAESPQAVAPEANAQSDQPIDVQNPSPSDTPSPVAPAAQDIKQTATPREWKTRAGMRSRVQSYRQTVRATEEITRR